MKKVLLLLCCWLAVLGASAASYPDKLYLVGDVCGWTPTKAIEPDEKADGVYTWNSINLSSSTSYSYFSFLTATGSDWDKEVNIYDRYGANTKDETLTAKATIKKFAAGDEAKGTFSWKVTPGTYKVVADLVNMKVTLSDPNQGGNEGGDDPDPVVPPTGKYYIYFDASGSNWSAPHVWAWNTQDLCKTGSSFPGDAMTKLDNGLWYYETPYPDKGIPTGLKLSSAATNYSSTGDLTWVNGATYKSDGSYTKPAVNFEPTGTLPVIYINVYKDAEKTQLDDEIIDKDLAHKNYFSNAEYWLEANGCTWMEGAADVGSKDAPLALEIKARGNYTRKGFSKKPYKIKLGKKQNLLGMTPDKSKHYALITHADDPYGYMRNFVGFRLGEMIGLPWTPKQQPVEVVINGNYRGIYFLTESIRVGDGRVPITELADNADNPADLTGGYLVELDNYADDAILNIKDNTDKNGGNLMVTPDTPEEYSKAQKKFITEQFTTMNNLIAANNGTTLWSYLDQDDAARYYVVEEILGHYEAYHGSTYLYREKGEGQKWHFSPLWDCGHAFDGPNNAFFSDNALYGNNWIGSSSTHKGLRFIDSFMNKVKLTFQWLINKDVDGSASPYEKLLGEIDEYVSHVKAAAERDADRWTGEALPTQVGLDVPSAVVNNSDIESHDKGAVKDYLNQKINWLKGQWGSSALPEPTRDETPAAQLPDYVKEGYVAPTYDIYVVDDASKPWGNVHMWLYIANGANYSTNWPGFAMDYDEKLIIDGHTGAYHFSVPEDFFNGLVIFSCVDAKGNTTTQYPGANQSGLSIADKKVFHTNGNKWAAATSIDYVKPYSGTLPVVHISTVEQGGTSDATRTIGYGDAGQLKKCSFSIDALGLEGYADVTAATAGKLSIKGRGKDWEEGKKNSYKLKLGNKTALLGMKKSAHWVLMPYRYDSANGLLTNYTGHELSRLIGLTWTPSMVPVEVMIDGEYQGLYFLAENVRAAADRVPIADYGDTAAKNGKDYSEEHDFLLEIDADHDEANTAELFHSWVDGNGTTSKLITSTPALEDINDAQAEARIRQYLQTHISELQDAVTAAAQDVYDGKWMNLIDYEQAAKYYVVQEIMDDPRSFTNNFYIYHTSVSEEVETPGEEGSEPTTSTVTTGSKWSFGPVWDFSGAFSGQGDKNSLFHEAAGYDGTFIKDLYANHHFRWFVYATFYKFHKGVTMPSDPSQLSKVAGRRKAEEKSVFASYDPQMNGKFTDVLTSIDAMKAKIKAAVAADAAVWSEHPATTDDSTLDDRVDALEKKLMYNVTYLGTPTSRDGAGWGQQDIITGVEDITLGATEGECEAEYFDLMGHRVNHPQPGSILIVRRGTQATKEYIR